MRAALRGVLPDHAVPTAYVLLDALPLTPNHKIDRAALPDPLTARETGPAAGARGAGPLERAVAEAWREVLGTGAVALDDNFFDLGGTSLRVAAVHERLTRTVAPGLRMTDLYRAPTIRSLVRLIGSGREDSAAAAARGARRRTAARGGARRAAARTRPAGPPPHPQQPAGGTSD
ncbi:hypothetical protein DMH15_13935 [Streptomyces sp. WAC 06725]|nr:hypothetical protein DMH15_13935 [Streptomyces sp. WAC 06725]